MSARAGSSFEPAAPPTRHVAAQLKLFAIRCLQLADRVAENQIAFLDAIDLAHDAALESGVTDAVGDDIVQATMAACFANAKRPRR